MPLSVLHGLAVDVSTAAGEAVVRVRGSLAESARVFAGVEARYRDGAVEVTVLATLVGLKRGGGTEFDETVRVPVEAAGAPVRYRQPDGTTVPLGGGEEAAG